MRIVAYILGAALALAGCWIVGRSDVRPLGYYAASALVALGVAVMITSVGP